MNIGRGFHKLVVLQDGRVLAVGGRGNTSQGTNVHLQECEIYDVQADTWTNTGSFLQFRPPDQLAIVLLNSGEVLLVGGGGEGNTGIKPAKKCEIYQVSSGSWRYTAGTLTQGRQGEQLRKLQNGNVAVIGGTTENQFGGLVPATMVEIFDPATELFREAVAPTAMVDSMTVPEDVGGTLQLQGQTFESEPARFYVEAPTNGTVDVDSDTGLVHYIPAPGFAGMDSFRFRVSDELRTSDWATVTVTVTAVQDAPVADSKSVSTNVNTPVSVVLTGTDADGDVISFFVSTPPSHGTLSGIPPQISYTPSPDFTGTDSFAFKANDGTSDSAPATVTVQVNATTPIQVSSAFAAPNPAAINTTVNFSFPVTDDQALTWSWNFGDGNTGNGEQTTHSFSASGTYTIIATATDASGASTQSIFSVNVGRNPIARFTTSDVVGFATYPFVFDATLSSDPENGIVSYKWDFGDGSPAASGQQVTRVFEAEGTYTVTLAVTDNEGLTAFSSRQIEILASEELGLFNGSVSYSVKWDRRKENVDSLSVEAEVNVGNDTVVAGTAVAVEIAGKRFESTLDKKLRAKSAKETWQVIANTRKQRPGEAILRLKAVKSSLGAKFNQAGALPGGDDEIVIGIPVFIQIGSRSFEMLIDSEFKFTSNGAKAKGSGEGP
jgi:PKD repeat protein